MKQNQIDSFHVASEAQERVIETWLRDEVVPAMEALIADTSRALSIDEARDRLLGRSKSNA
jgi:antitoxin ParD1/3/4